MKTLFFAGVLPSLMLACSTPDVKAPIEDRESAKGRIAIPLTSTSTSGAMYQLSVPSLVLDGDDGTQEYNLADSSELNVSVKEGDYSLSINDWTLYKVNDTELVPVEAEILSDNPQLITIYGGETTNTVIRFKTINGSQEEVSFENGDLNLVVEVDDTVEEETPESSEPPYIPTCGEEIHNGDVAFTDQDQFNQFTSQYGAVQGTLTLQGEGIVDASNISCLSSTSLIVEDTLIQNLFVVEQEYLHKLTVVDNPQLLVISIPVDEVDHLSIIRNETLTELYAEQRHSYNVYIQDNPSLDHVDMCSLEEASSDFYVENNPNLQHMDTTAVRYIGGRTRLIENGLSEVAFLSLEMTAGYVLIEENPSLLTIEMPSLFLIGDLTDRDSENADLRINGNDSLVTVEASNLFYISRQLQVRNNAELETLNGFSQLLSTNRVQIDGNARLNDIMGISTLESTGDFVVQFNPHLSQAMVDYITQIEIGEGSLGNVFVSGNSQVSVNNYEMTSCAAEYLAVESGDVYPVGSTQEISTDNTTCDTTVNYPDGTVWTIDGDCVCN